MTAVLLVGFIVETGCLLGVILLFWKRERQISDLTDYLTKVQDHLTLPKMRVIEEGRIGILQSEIYKVVALLQESYSKEKKQKNFLADSLSDISHQIKTPLTAISVMTEILMKEEEFSESRSMDYISRIEGQVNKITWLIRNLLTLSQLEADVLELKSEPVSVRELLLSVQESFEILAEVKGVRFGVNTDCDFVLYCDRKWTGEALSNLVKNCIEHTEEGGCVRLAAEQDNLATHFYVSDTGEGIAREHLPHIFERFYKAEKAAESVGIGLAMADQIIVKQNGVIAVESEVGKGTKFHIKMYRGRKG